MTIISTSIDRYTSGAYLAENPDWHEDDSPWKVGHIEAMLKRNGVTPSSICEVGCGSGMIVELLADAHPDAKVSGFEISPQAFDRCLTRKKPNLSYTLGSPLGGETRYDLTMAIDVIEHVEDPYAFARGMRDISTWQMFHIPLDMNGVAVMRGWPIMNARSQLGHLSYFTRDTALAMLRDAGLTVVDDFYTPWAIDQSYKTWKKRIAAWPRKLAFGASPHAAVRVLGGWSLMALTRSWGA